MRFGRCWSLPDVPGALLTWSSKSPQEIPKETAKRIVESIDALGEVDDPKRYIKKLKGTFGVPLYSFRVGDHRVILSVSEEALVIYVIEVGNRSLVYRNY